MKAINFIILILLFLGSLFGQQIHDKQTRKQLMHQFNQQYNNQFETRFNENTGTPSSIIGHKISKYRGSALEIAKAFLIEQKRMLGISDVERDMKLEKTNISIMGGKRFLFAQRYKGIPVLNSGYLIAVNTNGEIYFISGDYYPEISVDTEPALPYQQIKDIVINDLSQAPGVNILKPILSVYPELVEGSIQYVLVYKIQAQTQNPLNHFEYLINAKNGEIVHKQNLIEKINGNGDVYQTNPLHDDPLNRIIHRLRDLNPRKLDGDNVIVYNYETEEASSASATFVYDPTNTHFDEVMAYYHSDEFESWLINNGMETNRVNKSSVWVHYYTYYAATNPITRTMYFQDDASGLRNPTHEAAVIAHEYTHIVSETYNSLIQNEQAQAMDEGYSDFFALAYKNQFVSSSIIGEYIDEPGGLIYSRNLVNNHTMSEYSTIDLEPNGNVEEHDRSVIFSGGLWDFRRDNDVNNSIADQLVLESLNNLDNSPSFLDGRDALKAAAIASGYSNYTNNIDVAFANHEIGQDPLSVNISGPTWLDNYEYGTFTANPSGGSGSYVDYKWWSRNDEGIITPLSLTGGVEPNAPLPGLWNQVSSWDGLSTVTPGYNWDFSLKCEVTDSEGNTATDIHSVIVGSPLLAASQQNREMAISAVPAEFSLQGNYPNPFNPVTTIRFGLPEAANVKLVIYSVTGAKVATLVDGYMSEGYHEAQWNGVNQAGARVASGIYIYELISGEKRFIKKMLLAK